MKLGIHGVLVDTSTITVTELARAVEERGFESLWLPEHSHMPVDTVNPRFEGPLPDFMKRMPDPYVLLAAAAAVTTTIRLGTHVSLIGLRDPLVLAKEVASLDQLSQGRVSLGIGYGWNDIEMRNQGEDPGFRRAIVREKLEALYTIWSEHEPSYDGEHVRFAPSWSYPKPVQQPRPPILFGTQAGPKNFGDIMSYGDGWLPVTRYAGDRFPAQLAEFWAAADAAGRDRSSLEITLSDAELAIVDVSVEEFRAARHTPASIEGFIATGIDRLVLGVPCFDRDRALGALDDVANLIDLVAANC